MVLSMREGAEAVPWISLRLDLWVLIMAGGTHGQKAKAEGVRYSFPGAAPKSGRFASLKSSTPPKGPLSEDRDERLSQDGEQAVKGISKVEFEAWERDTFEDSFAVRAIMRATGHGYISENLKQIAKAPNWVSA
jgi:hypothetical protein